MYPKSTMYPKPPQPNQTDHAGVQHFAKQRYGHTRMVITKADLAHLLNGGCLTVDIACGEYTGSIELAE